MVHEKTTLVDELSNQIIDMGMPRRNLIVDNMVNGEYVAEMFDKA